MLFVGSQETASDFHDLITQTKHQNHGNFKIHFVTLFIMEFLDLGHAAAPRLSTPSSFTVEKAISVPKTVGLLADSWD